MRRYIIVLLLFAAGCATLRTPESVGPGAPVRPAHQDEPALVHVADKIEQPVSQDKLAEPAPPISTEPSHPAAENELLSAHREAPPASEHKPKPVKPSLSSKELPIPDHKLQGLTQLAATNDAKLLNVFVGMYRKAVEGIMGTAQNPYKRQAFTGADGQVYDILFYLTREPRKGRPIKERMLTPVIFKKSRVAAIGSYQLKKLIRTGTLGRRKTVT